MKTKKKKQLPPKSLSFGKKLTKVMEHFGLTSHGDLKVFSDKTKVSTQMLWNITNEKTKSPSVEVAAQILKAFPTLSAEWLMRDKGEIEISEHSIPSHPIDFAPKLEADQALKNEVESLKEELKTQKQINEMQAKLIALMEKK